jgi:hypothetical protein
MLWLKHVTFHVASLCAQKKLLLVTCFPIILSLYSIISWRSSRITWAHFPYLRSTRAKVSPDVSQYYVQWHMLNMSRKGEWFNRILQTTYSISANTSIHKVSLKSRGRASQLDGEILVLFLCKKLYISLSLWYLPHQHLYAINLGLPLTSGFFVVGVFFLSVSWRLAWSLLAVETSEWCKFISCSLIYVCVCVCVRLSEWFQEV